MENNKTYENIGNAIFIFNEIEFFISCIITHHIKPLDPEFFMDIILNTNVVNYGSKIKILINLKIFNNDEIKILRNLSTYRNVFAHSNRSNSISISNTNQNYYNVNVDDVIYQSNTDGKITKKNYSLFLIEFDELKQKAIQLIHNYIENKDVKTYNTFSSNLLRFL